MGSLVGQGALGSTLGAEAKLLRATTSPNILFRDHGLTRITRRREERSRFSSVISNKNTTPQSAIATLYNNYYVMYAIRDTTGALIIIIHIFLYQCS